MKKTKIVGIKKIQYTAKDGSPRAGVELHIAQPPAKKDREAFEGLQVSSHYLNLGDWQALTYQPKVNDEVLVDWGEGYGGHLVIEDIQKV